MSWLLHRLLLVERLAIIEIVNCEVPVYKYKLKNYSKAGIQTAKLTYFTDKFSMKS